METNLEKLIEEMRLAVAETLVDNFPLYNTPEFNKLELINKILNEKNFENTNHMLTIYDDLKIA